MIPRRDMFRATLGAFAGLLLGGRTTETSAKAEQPPTPPPDDDDLPPSLSIVVPFDDRFRAANAILGVGTGDPMAYPGRPGYFATSVVMKYQAWSREPVVLDVRFGERRPVAG